MPPLSALLLSCARREGVGWAMRIACGAVRELVHAMLSSPRRVRLPATGWMLNSTGSGHPHAWPATIQTWQILQELSDSWSKAPDCLITAQSTIWRARHVNIIRVQVPVKSAELICRSKHAMVTSVSNLNHGVSGSCIFSCESQHSSFTIPAYKLRAAALPQRIIMKIHRNCNYLYLWMYPHPLYFATM